MGMTLSVEGTKRLDWIPAFKGTFRVHMKKLRRRLLVDLYPTNQQRKFS
jgi:hypothetical protein